MAESLELQDALKSLKCCLCQKVLSKPPIIVILADGNKLICGRCKNVKKPFTVRNFAFENIVKFFSFPCIYEDCNKMIPWKDVERHEDICEKKTIRCPIFYQECEDIVLVQNLKEHMEQKHSSNIHYGNFTSILKLYCVGVYFVISNNQQFFVMIRNFDISKVYVTSVNNYIDECFTYNLKVSSICEDSFSVLIENQLINKYEENDHCSKCFSKQCDLIYHSYSRVNNSESNNVDCKKINLSRIINLFGDISKMKYTIEFLPKKDYEENNEKLTSLNPTENTTKPISPQSSQCYVCQEYLIDNNVKCGKKDYHVCSKCSWELRLCSHSMMY